MPVLAAILEEAQSHPSLANTTVLSADQFRTSRGPSSPQFRGQLDAAIAGSDGLEIIEPISGGIHGGIWYLRNLTHLGETFPAGEAHYRSLVEALQAAVEWWQADPACREIIVRSYYIARSEGATG